MLYGLCRTNTRFLRFLIKPFLPTLVSSVRTFGVIERNGFVVYGNKKVRYERLYYIVFDGTKYSIQLKSNGKIVLVDKYYNTKDLPEVVIAQRF